jgi:hypothetical protein
MRTRTDKPYFNVRTNLFLAACMTLVITTPNKTADAFFDPQINYTTPTGQTVREYAKGIQASRRTLESLDIFLQNIQMAADSPKMKSAGRFGRRIP